MLNVNIDQEIEDAKILQKDKKYNEALAKLDALSDAKLRKKQKFEITLLTGILKMNLAHYDDAKE